MNYTPPLLKATLIKRYKRFLADVILADGSETTIYCANTGAMTGCATPGDTVWLVANNNPNRKYKLSWELTQTKAGHIICVNTARANQLVEQAISLKIITELRDYQSIQREVNYGDEKSRIDFLLTDHKRANCYVEVKSCTLLAHGQGYFPDTVTTRGQKHLRELIQMKQQGYRSILLFAVLHTGIEQVSAAKHLDPIYAQLIASAINNGVEVLAYRADISVTNIRLKNKITFQQ